MKYIFFAAIAIALLAAGCSQQAAREAAPSSAEGAEMQETLLPDTAATGETKQFTMTAKQWEFSPNTITVNQGDTVILNIESIDVEHGFAIDEYGINENLQPGKTVEIEFVADKKGAFEYYCSVGEHRKMGMVGTLTVN